MASEKNVLDGLESLGSEVTNSERMHRMKRIMRDIYREEFERKRIKLPPVRAQSMIVVLSIISVIVFGVTTLYNFNRFVTLEERVLSSRGHIEDALQRRSNLFDNLVNVALNQAKLEQQVFTHVAEVRSRLAGRPEGITNPPEAEAAAPAPQAAAETPPAPTQAPTGLNLPDGLLEKLAGADNPMAQLMAIVEQYPKVRFSATYQQLMDKLVEIENRIAMRRDEYNEEVRIYNTLISSFPWNVLASITNFRRHDYFHSEASHKDSRFRVPVVSLPASLKLKKDKEFGANTKPWLQEEHKIKR